MEIIILIIIGYNNYTKTVSKKFRSTKTKLNQKFKIQVSVNSQLEYRQEQL